MSYIFCISIKSFVTDSAVTVLTTNTVTAESITSCVIHVKQRHIIWFLPGPVTERKKEKLNGPNPRGRRYKKGRLFSTK